MKDGQVSSSIFGNVSAFGEVASSNMEETDTAFHVGVVYHDNGDWCLYIFDFNFVWLNDISNDVCQGLAVCIHQLPYQFSGKHAIGSTVYIFNLVLFLAFNGLIMLRFWWWKHSARNSWLHPTEALFIPSWLVSIGVILIGGTIYGVERSGPWFLDTMKVFYWIYIVLSLMISSLSFLVM